MTDTVTFLLRVTVEIEAPDPGDLACTEDCISPDEDGHFDGADHKPATGPPPDDLEVARDVRRDLLGHGITWPNRRVDLPSGGSIDGVKALPSGSIGDPEWFYEWAVTDARIVGPENAVCGWCRSAFPARSVSGRQRRYCSDRCRQAAYRARRA